MVYEEMFYSSGTHQRKMYVGAHASISFARADFP